MELELNFEPSIKISSYEARKSDESSEGDEVSENDEAHASSNPISSIFSSSQIVTKEAK